MSLEELIELLLSFEALVIVIPIVYFTILLVMICKISKRLKACKRAIVEMREYTQKTNDLTLLYLKQYTTQLERIAKALEEESEPYIIEKEDE